MPSGKMPSRVMYREGMHVGMGSEVEMEGVTWCEGWTRRLAVCPESDVDTKQGHAHHLLHQLLH